MGAGVQGVAAAATAKCRAVGEAAGWQADGAWHYWVARLILIQFINDFCFFVSIRNKKKKRRDVAALLLFLIFFLYSSFVIFFFDYFLISILLVLVFHSVRSLLVHKIAI